MASQLVSLPPRHPAQVEFCRDPARFKALAAGRRWGKRIIGIGECFRRGMAGQSCWWIAPSYTSASFSSAWSMVRLFARQIPHCYLSQQKHSVHFGYKGQGGWLRIMSAEEPDVLRGEGIDFVAVDEAAHVKNLMEIWQQCLRPTLSDRQGQAWFVSTPKGYNFFQTIYNRGLRRASDNEWSSHRYPSSTNPFLRPEEIEAAKHELPSLVFRQEYLAEFVQLSGALFKREWFAVLGVITENLPACNIRVRAWDLAFSEKDMSDYTVGVRCGLTSDGLLCIEDVVRGRWEWPDAQRQIVMTAKMDGPSVEQSIEDNGTQKGYLQLLKREPTLCNIRLTASQGPEGAAGRDKIARAMPLLSRCESGRVRIKQAMWNQAMIDELTSFPEGQHDDQVDALSAAVNHMARSSSIRTTEGMRVGTMQFTPALLNITRL